MSPIKENEKKVISKSMKLSPDENRIISEKAKQKNMNFSRYMIESALNNDSDSIKPVYLCKIEDITEQCLKFAEEVYEKQTDVDTIAQKFEEIRKAVSELWEY